MDKHCHVKEITKPTRGKNILELVITNNEDLIQQLVVQCTRMSDHNMVKTVLSCKTLDSWKESRLTTSRQKWIGKPWTRFCPLRGKTANEMLSIIKENLLFVCQLYVPLKSSKRQKKRIPRKRRNLWATKRRHQRKTADCLSSSERSATKKDWRNWKTNYSWYTKWYGYRGRKPNWKYKENP